MDADPPDVLLLAYEYRDHVTDELLGLRTFDDVGSCAATPSTYVVRQKVPNFGVYHRAAFLARAASTSIPHVLYNEDVAFHHRLALAGLRFDYEPALTCLNYRYGGSMSRARTSSGAPARRSACWRRRRALRSREHSPVPATSHRSSGSCRDFRGSGWSWDAADAAAPLGRTDLGGRTPEAGKPRVPLPSPRSTASPRAPSRERLIRTLRPHLRASA